MVVVEEALQHSGESVVSSPQPPHLAEEAPELQALVSSMSAGPVAPGDVVVSLSSNAFDQPRRSLVAVEIRNSRRVGTTGLFERIAVIVEQLLRALL